MTRIIDRRSSTTQPYLMTKSTDAMTISSPVTRSILCVFIALCSYTPAQAQNYPLKPVRIVLPYPAGGSSDAIVRAISQKLSAALGQPIVIDNRAGAGGSVGTENVARSQPDGYTLLIGTSGTHGINPSLYARLPYDPVKDFSPISLVTLGMNVLVVHPSVPAKSTRELITLAKSRPGKLNFSSAGNGATSHLAGEMLKMLAGINIVHVPFKGAEPAITSLISGEVDLAILNIPALLPQIRANKLRALAVASTKRSSSLPDLPTLIETGLADFDASSWNGLFAPAATPRDVVARLNTEVTRIVRLPDVVALLSSYGTEPAGNTAEQFEAFVKSEISRWAKVVKASGARVD